MGQRTSSSKKREVRFFIPEKLYKEICLILQDPFTGKTRKGAISIVGEQLFAEWVRQVEMHGLPVSFSEKLEALSSKSLRRGGCCLPRPLDDKNSD